MNSQNREKYYAATITSRGQIKKYYAATIILPRDKREMRNKNNTATELNREREKRRGNSTNSRNTGKITAKIRNRGKSMKMLRT
jgi:hypothetical protein